MILNFDYEGPAVVNEMSDLIVGISDHLDTTPSLDIDFRVKYIERILKRATLNNFISVLVSCKENITYEAGYIWTMGEVKNVPMEYFW